MNKVQRTTGNDVGYDGQFRRERQIMAQRAANNDSQNDGQWGRKWKERVGWHPRKKYTTETKTTGYFMDDARSVRKNARNITKDANNVRKNAINITKDAKTVRKNV